MEKIITFAYGGIFLIISSFLFATEIESATIAFDEQGFSVQTTPEASQLQIRLVGPERSVIFEEITIGTSISWQLTGYETDGQYSYEIIVVSGNDGGLQQRNLPGGFEIKKGVIIPPVLAVGTQSDFRKQIKRPSFIRED